MAEQNLNSSYLNSDAVVNYMQAADLTIGDGNGQLSSNELSQFMNENIVFWPVNPPRNIMINVTRTTGDQLISILSEGTTNPENLAHFQVYLILGVYLLAMSQRTDIGYVNYNELVARFNQTYGIENASMPRIPPEAGVEVKECRMCHESYPVHEPVWIMLHCGCWGCAKCISKLCVKAERDLRRNPTGEGVELKCPLCRKGFPERFWLGRVCGQAYDIMKAYNLPIPSENISGGRTRRKRKGGAKSRKSKTRKL